MHATMPITDTPELYEGVPTKRAIAWCVDVVIITIATLLSLPFTLFAGLFVLPVLYLIVGFLYRWATVAGGSATWGMRLAGIELRRLDGERLDPATAFFHVSGHTFAICTFPLALISAAVMYMTEKGQGLTDLVLGTVALRRAD